MLLRMYTRWAEQHGYKVEYLEETAGEEVSVASSRRRSRSTGHNAFGWLKSENGVHRLVRISPFDSNARRHTSFASVNVYPVVDDRIIIDINEAGRAHRHHAFRRAPAASTSTRPSSTAVRLTHIPTGIAAVVLPGRALPAQEPGDRLDHAAGAPL